MKTISRSIIDNIGGTEYGPAASFKEIVSAIVKNTNEVLPVATRANYKGISEPVFVSVPIHLGRIIGSSLYETLSYEEKKGIEEAAETIYQTYQDATEALDSAR